MVLLVLSLYITITAREIAGPLLGLAAKWLIVGRTRPGAYPLWGAYYLRRMLSHQLLQVRPLTQFLGLLLLPHDQPQCVLLRSNHDAKWLASGESNMG